MPRKDDDVGSHEGGSRGYLGDEVRAQRVELTELGKQVAAVNATVATLLEADKRAGASRNEIWREVNGMKAEVTALRSEQQQVMQSTVATQAGIGDIKKILNDDIKKKLDEHEADLQQRHGALKLATASARFAWTVIGILSTAAAGAFAWIIKFMPSSHPPAPPHP